MGSNAPPTRRKEVTRTIRPSHPAGCGGSSSTKFSDRQLVKWDGPVEPLFGYSLSDTEIEDNWWLSRIHPDDRSRVAESLAKHLLPTPDNQFSKDSRIWGSDYRFRHANGNYVLVADRAITNRDEYGNFKTIVSVIFDKEIRRSEREAHARSIQSQDHLALIANNTPSALYMMDPNGYCIYMNSAAEQITGFTIQEINDYTFHASCHSCRPNGDPYPIHECPIFRHAQDGTAAKNESEVFVHKDGHYYDIEYSVSPIGKYASGGAVIEFRDVTEQKILEKERLNAIRITEQQSSRIKADEVHKANMTSFVSFVCHELRNPLQGITSSAEFLLETLRKLDDLSSKLSEVSSGQKLTAQTETISSNSQTDRRIHTSSRQPKLTEDKSRNPEAATKLEMKRLITGARELVGNIHTCADHQALIINNVLDLSRLDAGMVEPLSEVLDVQALGQQVVMMMSAKAQAKHITLSKNSTSQPLFLKVDATLLKQVLLNLVSNAIKFTPEHGKITIDLCADTAFENGKAILRGSVTDNGLGMSEVEQQKLFQRFSQANRKVAQLYGGSGLGLSISRELVRILSGEIEVESSPGKGSTFSFTSLHDVPTRAELSRFLGELDRNEGKAALPLGEPEKVITKALVASNPPKFRMIGVAEDNPINLKYMARNLQALGYKYTLATNGQEILDKFSHPESIIDCCILDMSMPVMDGLEAARLIRLHEASDPKQALRPPWRTPMIGLSGNALKEQVSDALSAGLSDYLIKPCKQADLARTLQYWERVVHTGAEHVPMFHTARLAT